jgi:predicted transposase YdaD
MEIQIKFSEKMKVLIYFIYNISSLDIRFEKYYQEIF